MTAPSVTTPALEELKVRARIARNAAARTGAASAPRLADCLHQAARAVGFQHWEHARRVLGGLAQPGEDMGSFWYAPACSALLNPWFADLGRARLARDEQSFLLPYRRQFVVVRGEFIRALGLDPFDPDWSAAGRDLTACYGSAPWGALCMARLRAQEARFEAAAASIR
ncbi:hypothetical protein GCM10027034_09880 [Ramlibacter solisilvae]|uniref:hypothetical protein n=1 Tax=Ramlibacter tataouinensis TaxID=94132 RepID=UPI0007774580|nr:hypothetical protein [Ramlibacter tataouinensis]